MFFVCLQRLASLLIVTQLVNQVTEVVIPFLVDRFISAPHRTEHKDDPQEDKFRNQSTLPAFPVSSPVFSALKQTLPARDAASRVFTGLVCRIHRAPGAVWVFESFLLRVSSHGRLAAHQQPDGDPVGRLQDVQALP